MIFLECWQKRFLMSKIISRLNIIRLYQILFFLLPTLAFAQEDAISHKKVAEDKLELALLLDKENNLLESYGLIVSDSLMAIKIAEPILFKIYGEKNIVFQKPYKSYLINNYWVILGSLPKNFLGGTFSIIIDARNARILWIMHDK